MISTVIIKPTKECNAECTYCSAPPDFGNKWTLDEFKFYFDKIAPHLSNQAFLIWHGGEPMLMGPDFYNKAFEYARSINPEIRFSLQSNMLSYDTKRWKDVFVNVFGGSVSTSFDLDIKDRVFKGSAELYAKIFRKRLEALLEDGFHPKVVSTYTDETIPMADKMYEWALSQGDNYMHLRFNYRYPAGRDHGKGELISPIEYGKMLIRLYNRWIVELPNFVITPLDEMFKKAIRLEQSRCPWTRSCGGHFLGLEPNGDIYNCADFADLGDLSYRFGNLNEHSVTECLRSNAATQMRRRKVNLPFDCTQCRHYYECEGGCMRDAALYDRGIGGKFYYCDSWKMVFDRIKESIRTKEADGAIRKYDLDPDKTRIQLGPETLNRTQDYAA